MKKLALIFLLFSTTTLLSAQTNFRNTTWGMSKQEVKSVENIELLKEIDNALVYKTEIAGFQCYVYYIFINDQLSRAKYYLLESHTNMNDHISDYKKLKKLLTKKYGSPVESEQIWRDDLYKGDYNDWGMAISVGDMMYYSEWEIPETDVLIMLYGENYEINHQIEYSSKKFAKKEKEQKEKETLDEL